MRISCAIRISQKGFILLGIMLCCCSCLYSRLLSFKEQLASFDKYVVITNGGCALEFLIPVVDAGDLSKLTGSAPTRIDLLASGQQMHTYRYRNISSIAVTGSPQVLSFTLLFTSNKLCAFEYPKVVAEVLGSNLVMAAAKAIGNSRLIQWEHKLEWSLGTNQTSTIIPSLATVTRVFGPAQEQGTNNILTGLHANYQYLLEGTNGNMIADTAMTANFDFDPKTSLLRHGIMKVGKLKLVVDFPVSH